MVEGVAWRSVRHGGGCGMEECVVQYIIMLMTFLLVENNYIHCFIKAFMHFVASSSPYALHRHDGISCWLV